MRRDHPHLGLPAALLLLVPLMSAGRGEAEPFTAMRATRAVPPVAAPELKLPTAEGGTMTLADLRGKAVIVGFFVTT